MWWMKPYSAAEEAEFKLATEQASQEARRFFEQHFGAVQMTVKGFGCQITTGTQVYDQPHTTMVGHTYSIREQGPAPEKVLFELGIERLNYPHQVMPQSWHTVYGSSHANELRPPGRDFQILIVYSTTRPEDEQLLPELRKALLVPFAGSGSPKGPH